MNTDNLVQEIAEALRGAGVEVGYVGGERFRQHVAEKIAPLVSREITKAKAEALREAAEALDTTDHATETALQGIDHALWWLHEVADQIEESIK